MSHSPDRHHHWYIMAHCLLLRLFLVISIQNATTCEEGNVRLVGSLFEGRVEVCYNNAWTSPCDFGWNTIGAGVVCRQLGFPFDDAVPLFGPQIPPTIGSAASFAYHCTGNEIQLTDCQRNESLMSCNRSEDTAIGVRCRNTGMNDFQIGNKTTQTSEIILGALLSISLLGNAVFLAFLIYTRIRKKPSQSPRYEVPNALSCEAPPTPVHEVDNDIYGIGMNDQNGNTYSDGVPVNWSQLPSHYLKPVIYEDPHYESIIH